jgi:hypothetical protein
MQGFNPAIFQLVRVRQFEVADRSVFRTRQAPISMRICTRLASGKLTLFPRFSATSGAPNRQGLVRFGCHGYIMQRCSAIRCSVLLSSFPSDTFVRLFCANWLCALLTRLKSPEMRKFITELFASETKSVRFVRKSCLSIHATRSSRASSGKPRMIRQKDTQCVSSLLFVLWCSRS